MHLTPDTGNRYALSIAVVLCLGVAVGYGFSTLDVDGVSSPTSFSDNPEIQIWQELIREHGAPYAYARLQDRYKNVRANVGHEAAHVFGGALYVELGRDGIAVCNSSLAFGCYHELIGQAIAREGLSVVHDLNDACGDLLDSEFFGCQHGIGHGILAHLGYEADKLPEALDVCRTLKGVDPISGCYGGAVMEYNVRTMLAMDGAPFRPLDEGQYHAPCTDIPEYAQQACYYWQPQWWELILGGEARSVYGAMGDFCTSLENPNRAACFMGIGNNTVNTTSNPEQVVKFCKAAADGRETEVRCRAAAAVSFFVSDALEHVPSERICEGLTSDEYAYCDAFRRNEIDNIHDIF